MEIWERSQDRPWFGGVSAEHIPFWERRNLRSTGGKSGRGKLGLEEPGAQQGVWEREIWERELGPRGTCSTERNLGEAEQPKRNLEHRGESGKGEAAQEVWIKSHPTPACERLPPPRDEVGKQPPQPHTSSSFGKTAWSSNSNTNKGRVCAGSGSAGNAGAQENPSQIFPNQGGEERQGCCSPRRWAPPWSPPGASPGPRRGGRSGAGG